MKKLLKMFLCMFSLVLLLSCCNTSYASEKENDILYITTSAIYNAPQYESDTIASIPIKYEIEKDGVLYSYEDIAPYIYDYSLSYHLVCQVDKTKLLSQGGSAYDGASIPYNPYVNGVKSTYATYSSDTFKINGHIVEYKTNNADHDKLYLFHDRYIKFPDPLTIFGSIKDSTNYTFDGWYKYNGFYSRYEKFDVAEEERLYLNEKNKSYIAKWILNSNLTFSDELLLGNNIPTLNVPSTINKDVVASWYDLTNLDTVYDDALAPSKAFDAVKTYVLHIETKVDDAFDIEDLIEVKIGDEIIPKQKVRLLDSSDDYDNTLLDCTKLVKDKKINGWYIDDANTLIVNYIFPKTCTVIKAFSADELDKPISTDIEVEYVKPGEKLTKDQLACNYLAEDEEVGSIYTFIKWKTIDEHNNPDQFDVEENIVKDIIIFPKWDFLKATKQPTKEDPTYEFETSEYWTQGDNITYIWEKSTNYSSSEVDIKPLDETNGVIMGEFPAVAGDEDGKYEIGFAGVETPEDIKDGISAFGESGEYSQYIVIYSGNIANVNKVEVTFSKEIEDDNYSFYIIEDEADCSLDGKKLTINIRPTDIYMGNYIAIYIASNELFTITDIKITEGSGTFNEIPSETSNVLSNLEKSVYRCKATLAGHNLYSAIVDNREEDPEPAPTSGGSKTYKAKDEDKTAEKIAGSGKKGSKRTITPIDGKKVGRVVVTDKNGNIVDVTKNSDGTFSFIQPASDVQVEVTYVNREITLNIGSTEASVDGETSSLDVCPVIRNDRTMLPIRFVAENLGAKVEWDEKNPDYVLITKGDIKIEITLGSDVMKVNGKDVKLDVVAFAENDRTYLPVRAVSENLNAIVEWNEARPMEVKIYER